MKNPGLVLFFTLGALMLSAQTPDVKQRCGTAAPPEAWDRWFNQKVLEFTQTEGYNKDQAANYVIPVVFHVIHGGQSEGTFPNVSQAQINSQVNILNNDFAGTGFNVGNIVNTNFSPALIANCNVSFCLAEKDPSGNALTQKGIHRVNYNANSWANPTSFTTSTNFRNYIETVVKPNTIWDPTRYLNIWITDVNANVGLLGYATFPSGTSLAGLSSGLGTATTDGVWCWSMAIGNTGTLFNPYDKGRTATHEVGHWLGLRHIWGDAACATDYCNDTPTQQQANTGCPTFPSITCSNGPNGDMFINFMDYSDDACLYMFTPDQRTRIQTAMASCPFRTQLTASSATLCNSTPVTSCSDTISNFTNTDTLRSYRRATAGATDPGCVQGPGNAGYITGTNCYGDLEKAEFISSSLYSTITNPMVSGVIVLFFQYGNMGTDGTANVDMKIYSGVNANTAPGSLLGSKTENLATIAATTNTNAAPYCGNPNLAFSLPVIMPFKFTFSSPVSVSSSGGFFASVSIPQSTGDTVTILDKNTGVANTAWEKYSDNSWHDMKTSWGGTRNFNLAILPVMSCGPVGIKEQVMMKGQFFLYPNPGNGSFNLLFANTAWSESGVRIYNLFGQEVQGFSLTKVSNNQALIDISRMPDGVYFIELKQGDQSAVLKYVLQH
ncbi:MAG TPA: M43 family zinc metalloprotease [Bacteroidia bacterium]|nr:M43 family zinc metalloprotease [Bacteroidia bacterium]